MIYKKNKEEALSEELFRNPTSEYRGTPFWAWNNELTKEELCRQIDVFKEMGLGGFHMHVRTGLKNKYMSDEYMRLIHDCVDKAKAEEMLAWLYDEDRWPSGAAGGLVTANPEFRARNLLFTNKKDGKTISILDAASRAGRSSDCTLLAVYDVVLDAEGYLEAYSRIGEDDEAKGQKWYAFMDIHQPNSWYNDKTYVDTLNKKAIERFVEITHERYKDEIGDEFGKTVPAIFTDEPQFSHKDTFCKSIVTEETNVTLPWTDCVTDLYKETYGADILDTLPELFWDLPDSAPSLHRYRYHDFIAELFASSFADTVGSWCEKNGIALTGHMMDEPSLRSQCGALGEAMRSYRSFGIPGIDLLCNSDEFTTAKQAQSAAHQYGREGVLSELYGVTGWDADFRLYKHSGDWQAALGITVRVPHLSWYAMEGEAKRDYPASIHYQSAWYKKYKLVEDHFARVNTAMTRGKPVVKVGVIHPIESFWLHWGPNDKSGLIRENLDERFKRLTFWMLEGSIDFDFIAESLLPSQCEKAGAPLRVGVMEYDTIIVPACETLRSTTLSRLKEFREKGGRLIFFGDAPTLVDAVASDEGKALYEQSERVGYSRGDILTALESDRTITIRYANGRLADDFIYQLREDNGERWLFTCYSHYAYNKHINRRRDVNFIVKGEYCVELYDTQTGEIRPLGVKYENGNTVISRRAYDFDSFLFRLTEGRSDIPEEKLKLEIVPDRLRFGKVDYELSEPNVLLLDLAEYKLDDDGEYSPPEEILRLDNKCRQRLGWPDRSGHVVQPWAMEPTPDDHKLTLRYTFESEIDYTGAELALETADKAEVTFNGEAVSTEILGMYVDISINRRPLPPIKKGRNELIVKLPFGKRSNAESIFILGNFGVKVEGYLTTITALPEKIAFGDICTQGFPFYGANITYKLSGVSENGKLSIAVTDYYGTCVSVVVDGKEAGDIIYPPYLLTVPVEKDGSHAVDVVFYGNRYNSFGSVHCADEKMSWQGPGAWRQWNDCWCYEYMLRRHGILKQPVIGTAVDED